MSPSPRGPAARPARRTASPLLEIAQATLRTLCVCACILAASGGARAAAPQRFYGVFLEHEPGAAQTDGGYGSVSCRAALRRIARLGADSVLLVAHGYQSDPETPFIQDSIGSNWSTSDARLVPTIAEAHRLGLKVILAPRLSLDHGSPGGIQMKHEAGWQKWFEEYERWLLHYASLAQENRVDLLLVGCELGGTTQREAEWRHLVDKTRRVYDGLLGYAAHWGAELEAIVWWDAVDIIALQAYGSLSKERDPQPEQLLEGALELCARLSRVSERWDRPALIAETGYRSIVSCHREPWRQDSRAAADQQAQAAAYRAVVQAVRETPAISGVLWRGWSSDVDRVEKGDSYAVLGKAAEAELRLHWQRESERHGTLRPLGHGGMVVCSDSIATAVGVEILRDGGSAMDAAIATAFALAVSFPEAGNLGGGGFLLAYDPRRGAYGLDFREMAPLDSHEDMYLAWERQGDSTASRLGVRAAGIPGTVAGLYEAWQRAGQLPWATLVDPARRLAAEGFVVGDKLPFDLQQKRAQLETFSMSRSLFFRGDTPVQSGERLRQPELARTLERIADQGARGFYEGWVARSLVHEIRQAGGIWREEDLRHYRPRTLRPVALSLGSGESLLTLPPPSSGSVVLGQALYFLKEQRADRSAPESPERLRALTESLRLAFADRNHHLADPAVMSTRAQDLLQTSYLRRRARMLPRHGPGDSKLVAAGEARAEPDETTHLVVFDAEGRCVSMTLTLNALFGCGWASPSTGILLNNQMDDFDTKPGRPNLYGLVGTDVNRVRPGVRMLSSMSPCIALRGDDAWFALGGRGGPRILSALLQVIVHRAWDQWPLERAVAAPRMHHQWLPDTIQLEAHRNWPGLDEDLRVMGYTVEFTEESGKIHAIERQRDGTLIGVADPREHGLALAVDE